MTNDELAAAEMPGLLRFTAVRCTACPVSVWVARGPEVSVARIDTALISPQCTYHPDKDEFCPILARAIQADVDQPPIDQERQQTRRRGGRHQR